MPLSRLIPSCFMIWESSNQRGNITSGDAHCAVDYQGLLRFGLKEYARRAQEKLNSLDLTDYRNIHKSYFYRAVLIVVEAVRAFAGAVCFPGGTAG